MDLRPTKLYPSGMSEVEVWVASIRAETNTLLKDSRDMSVSLLDSSIQGGGGRKGPEGQYK